MSHECQNFGDGGCPTCFAEMARASIALQNQPNPSPAKEPECPQGSPTCKCTDEAHQRLRAEMAQPKPNPNTYCDICKADYANVPFGCDHDEPQAKEPGLTAWSAFWGDCSPLPWNEEPQRMKSNWVAVERAVLEAAGVEQLRAERDTAQKRAEGYLSDCNHNAELAKKLQGHNALITQDLEATKRQVEVWTAKHQELERGWRVKASVYEGRIAQLEKATHLALEELEETRFMPVGPLDAWANTIEGRAHARVSAALAALRFALGKDIGLPAALKDSGETGSAGTATREDAGGAPSGSLVVAPAQPVSSSYPTRDELIAEVLDMQDRLSALARKVLGGAK